jgi:hypothetical protein
VGYRDKGERSREDRDRRPPLANWSSAAEFGDATIDRPTPLNGRRDRAGRRVERGTRQSDLPTQRIRSDASGWSTITPVDEQYDDDPGADRRYADDDRDTAPPRFDTRPHLGPATGDPDELRRRRGRYSDDEQEPASDPRSWRGYDDQPARPRDTGPRPHYGGEPRFAEDEPRHSRRSIEEGPRRSRRALEESTRRAGDDEPRTRRHAYSDDPLGRPDISDLSSPRDRSASEPASRQYSDDSDLGSWRTRQTTEFESWRTENADAQRWRSETLSWRTRESIEVDTTDVDRPGTRAIGSSQSATGSQGRHADLSELETWRSETGTWRTRDTATTGSWRMPPASDDLSSPAGDTGEWRSRTTPETGSWSRSRGQWVPGTDDTGEQPDFTVRRYDDTGEISKDMLQATGGRILDYDEFYDAGRRGDDSGERRAGRRRVVDDLDGDRIGGLVGDRSDERPGRRTAGRFEGRPDEGRSDDDRPDTAARAPAGTRGSPRAPSPRSEEPGDGYRDVGEEPSRRSRYPHPDDDAPRYRAGRRSVGEPRTGRHASAGFDGEPERRPARAGARRAPAYAGPPGVADSVITPRASGGRAELVRVGRRPTVAEEAEDDAEEVAYGYAGAGLAAVSWFGLPIGAFLLWAVFLGGTARADCVGAAGRTCPAPRDAAFTTFAAHLPQVAVAIALSFFVALLIRLVSPFWRPATVGFAGSVVGAGVATVLFTVLNSG